MQKIYIDCARIEKQQSENDAKNDGKKRKEKKKKKEKRHSRQDYIRHLSARMKLHRCSITTTSELDRKRIIANNIYNNKIDLRTHPSDKERNNEKTKTKVKYNRCIFDDGHRPIN